MPKSMTGFGREAIDAPSGRFIVEIQSVNRKHFEAAIHLPKELSYFEHEIRKWVAEKVLRGSVSVRIQWIPSKKTMENLLPDLEVLKTAKNEWKRLSKQLGFDPKKIDLRFLLASMPPMQKTESLEEKDLESLKLCVFKALEAMSLMKDREGKALVKDLKDRLKTIQNHISSVRDLSSDATEKMRHKLLEKMVSLLPKDGSLDERILREVAIFAEKVDTSEELTRMESHFAQFEECLLAKSSVGRKMDFIIQEMTREINTIGSKSCEAKISYLVVELKSEIEKMREQIQNIE
jgi:uncharacterized protein (TIGR00255 family)